MHEVLVAVLLLKGRRMRELMLWKRESLLSKTYWRTITARAHAKLEKNVGYQQLQIQESTSCLRTIYNYHSFIWISRHIVFLDGALYGTVI